MKLRMEVTRFRSEDVLATSGVGPVVPPSDVCTHTGMQHVLAIVATYDASTNTTRVTGPSFIYKGKGDLDYSGGGAVTVTVPGQVGVRTFVYFDGNGYVVCDPQPHAR